MDNDSIVGALMDFSFSRFVTTKIVKILYILGVLVSALGALMILLGGLASGSILMALFCLILTPVVFVIYVMMCRIWLELVVVVFRIAENVAIIAKGASNTPPPMP